MSNTPREIPPAAVPDDTNALMEALLAEIKNNLARRHFRGDAANPGAQELMDELTDNIPRELWSRNPWVYWYMLRIRLEIADDREMNERYAEVRSSWLYREARNLAEETGSPLLTHIYLMEDAHTRACVSRTAPAILAERHRKAEEAEARRRAEAARKAAERGAGNATKNGAESDT